MVTLVMDLMWKWTRWYTADADAVQEAFAAEQLLKSMPVTVQVWVVERKPKTVAEGGKLADDHMEARDSMERSEQQDPQEGPRGAGARQYHKCHKIRYLARECPQRATPAQAMPIGPPPGSETKMDNNGSHC